MKAMLDFVGDPPNATFDGSGGMGNNIVIMSGPR